MHDPSALLELRVVPGASRSEVIGRHGAGWRVRVTAPPERGAANAAVVRLLSEALELSPRAIEIVSGRGGRDKTVRIAGIDPARAEGLLAAAGRKDPTE